MSQPRPDKTDPSQFLSSVSALRKRARKALADGAMTPDYGLDREAAVQVLNAALATELVCVLRYRRHHFMAKGLDAEPVAAEFLAHSNEEQDHADRLARRIVQLGGEPDFDPAHLTAHAHAEYVACTKLEDMIRENLVAERIAIESYREMIRYFGDADPTTRTLLEGILAVEESHADELADLLAPA
ncbi:MAG: bacterioferritin [Zoogloeaceae bacterium]|nr:bacterioferritin [Zoogloeaceae bacterium]